MEVGREGLDQLERADSVERKRKRESGNQQQVNTGQKFPWDWNAAIELGTVTGAAVLAAVTAVCLEVGYG